MTKKRKLLNAEQAKAMMAEAGDEFETPARRLIKDDFAELRTMSDWERAPVVLMKALGAGEITPTECNAAMKVLNKRLREFEAKLRSQRRGWRG